MYSYGNNIFFLESNRVYIYRRSETSIVYTFSETKIFEISNIKCCCQHSRSTLSEYRSRIYFHSYDSSEKSSWSSRKLKSSRIDSWVKSQLYRSAYIYVCTFIYLDDNRTLKWDTMCMKLYCSPESVGQFGPSADQAIVCHTYTIIKCIGIVYKNFRVNVSQGSIRIFFVRSNPPRRTFLQNLLFIEQSDLLVVLSIY